MAQSSRTGKVGPSLCTVPQPRNSDEIKPGGCQKEGRGYINWEARLRTMRDMFLYHENTYVSYISHTDYMTVERQVSISENINNAVLDCRLTM